MDAERAAELIAERIVELQRSQAGFVDEGVVVNDGTFANDGVRSNPADVGEELAERQTELVLLAQVERELDELRAAQIRVSDGTYGFCEQCGEGIGDERLEAIPWARACARHAI
jgi:RNA polymerase-binding transcription factor DksA